ncbi:Uncharacterized protein HZ326_13239 [Fusarium oxysporum f. sp. albedinis]|nr:Uncharacterized protein HZ326_13239 [Fusarium oxysporum f. sp. albedinis]
MHLGIIPPLDSLYKNSSALILPNTFGLNSRQISPRPSSPFLALKSGAGPGRLSRLVVPFIVNMTPRWFEKVEPKAKSCCSEILYNQAGLRHKRCPSGAWNTIRNWSQELIDEAGDIIKAGDVAAELPGGRAKNCQGRRWALYTTWRPLKPVKRDPMAYVDYWTADEQDGISFWRNSPGVHVTFELDVLLTKANPKHKWYWISDQTPDEILLMKITDTESEKNGSDVAGGVHHCSFHLPGTEDEEVRESIETKFITFR